MIVAALRQRIDALLECASPHSGCHLIARPSAALDRLTVEPGPAIPRDVAVEVAPVAPALRVRPEGAVGR